MDIAIIVLLSFLFFIIGYLIGSILFAHIISKIKNIDLRKTGSGNMGATNVMRALGKKWGLLTFVLDFWKSLVAIFLSMVIYWAIQNQIQSYYHQEGFIIYFAGIGVIIGHCFPISWIYIMLFFRNDKSKAEKYTGGKGAACMAGLFTAISPILLPIGVIVFWISLFIIRYVSLSSIISISILTILILVPEMNHYFMVDFPGFGNESIISGGLNSFGVEYQFLTISFSNNSQYLLTMFAVAFLGTGIIYFKHSKNLQNIYYRTERKAVFFWNKEDSAIVEK